jgi:anti-sigma factor RsiW
MRCRQYKAFASAHLDGRLTPQEAMKYGQHREACATCRGDLAELQQVSRVLKSMMQPEAPRQLRPELMAMIATE